MTQMQVSRCRVIDTKNGHSQHIRTHCNGADVADRPFCGLLAPLGVFWNLEFSHGVVRALDAGKLMYIDLNHRLPGRSDQDVSFGSADPRGAFSLINEGEDAGCVGSKYRRRGGRADVGGWLHADV